MEVDIPADLLSWQFFYEMGPKGYYLETDPHTTAMAIRVELFVQKPSKTNANWHCMVTHAQLISIAKITANMSACVKRTNHSVGNY